MERTFSENYKTSVREHLKDKKCREVVNKNLKSWPVGTFGVHSVELRWRKRSESQPEAQRGRPGGKTMTDMLLVVADRASPGCLSVQFRLVDIDSADSVRAGAISEMLNEFGRAGDRIHLTPTFVGDQSSILAVSQSTLQDVLGEGVEVVVDDPTINLGHICAPKNWSSRSELEGKLRSIVDNPRFPKNGTRKPI